MESAASVAALRVVGLAKRFGERRVLRGIDLELASGAALGLVGANGAGKTTLLKCLLDLCAADAGRVEIFGMEHTRAASRARLAFVPESFAPPHYLLGREFLAYTLALAGTRFERPAADRLLAELELETGALDRPVRQLSKGMTQKLGLAACFLVERELYVLDEPMSGLDPASRVAVKSVLARLNKAGRALFFTSHVLSDVEELCTTVAVLHEGALRFCGPPALLCERYAERRLELAYLKCIRSHGNEPAARA